MITQAISSLADHHLLAPQAIHTSGRYGSDRAAQSPNAGTWRLTIYDSSMTTLLEWIRQLWGINDCQVLDQDISTTHLFSGVEQYKAVLTLGVSRACQANLQRWYETHEAVGDIDLDPVSRSVA
jgi:hypothetical protein